VARLILKRAPFDPNREDYNVLEGAVIVGRIAPSGHGLPRYVVLSRECGQSHCFFGSFFHFNKLHDVQTNKKWK